MTSTKTDTSAIDLAGVEAGEKMLVPWPVEPPGSTAQSGLADQNRRSAICQPHSKLDFILSVNIYLLPFKTKPLPRRRTSPGRCFPWMILQLRSHRHQIESKRATKRIAQRGPRTTLRAARTLPIRLLTSRGDQYMRRGSVITLPLASSVIRVVTQSQA